jgi:hypothetical protein
VFHVQYPVSPSQTVVNTATPIFTPLLIQSSHG